ncbi:MAG: hypothetical protein Q8L99_04130 [Polycyclovorans sp.]|nr:hypothetical protein [Gammaproteobacteria bacterium]MDP1542318.1 hypothetical protein [Polycyclovorans sp.]
MKSEQQLDTTAVPRMKLIKSFIHRARTADKILPLTDACFRNITLQVPGYVHVSPVEPMLPIGRAG